MTSMISLIVVLLAACAYSAPVLPDFQNATLIMEVENGTLATEAENATVGFQAANVIIFARREFSDLSEDKREKVTVGLSSSEDTDSNETTETTGKLSEREFEDEPVPSTSETNMKRGVDMEVSEPAVVTEDSFSTENTKRSIDNEADETSNDQRSFTEDTKRGIDVEAFESSTGVDETSVSPASEGKYVKRSLDNQPWLEPESREKVIKRSVEIVQSSTDVDETSTAEESGIPSTSEVTHMERGLGEFASLTTEASEAFNRRAIGSVESVEAGESSTVIVVKVQPDSTTDEQPSSTVEYVDTTEESSSTSDYDTTVAPVEESTSASPIPTESTAKILAIIPGTISRTQFVVPPVQLTQGQNQTIIEDKKQNY